ncbi:MAG: nucleotide kinase domain-containing protein [Xanthobacteraceae bacterium]
MPAPIVLRHLAPAKVSEVYESYWRFAAERQAVFFRRARGEDGPWTRNAVLASHKFTNAYRASDRVSQYLIRHVIYRADLPNTPREVFFRILIFKLFNKIATWELLERSLGPITFKEYRFAPYDEILSRAMRDGRRIYSAAYIMPPGSSAFGRSAKHQNHLLLLERMMEDRLPERLAQTLTMQEGFEKFRAYPTIGDFLAYQFITDINYSEITDFNEMDFVVPGPGARDGLRKCFVDPGGLNEPELIRLMADLQEQEFERLGLDFQSLWGRRLQLIDCQNLFCEVDKYARVAHPQIAGRTGRTRIKQKFEPILTPIEFFYPPKWNLNEKIRASADTPLATARAAAG